MKHKFVHQSDSMKANLTLEQGSSPLEWDDMKKLSRSLEEEGKYILSLYILFASTTGYRAGDNLSFKWGEILNKEIIGLEEDKTEKTRKVQLGPEIQAAITRIHEKVGFPPGDRFVFSGRRSVGAWSIQYLNRQLKYAKATFPIKHKGQFSTHSLRKTFGKRVYDMGENKSHILVMLSKIFNHSNTTVTRRYIGLESQEIGDIYSNLY